MVITGKVSLSIGLSFTSHFREKRSIDRDRCIEIEFAKSKRVRGSATLHEGNFTSMQLHTKLTLQLSLLEYREWIRQIPS